jgi:phosphoglycerate kinase
MPTKSNQDSSQKSIPNHITLNSITNSRVLLRVNYDIPDVNAIERIKDSIPTINLLLENGNKVILLTHFGRPIGAEHNFSTQKISIQVEKTIHHPVMYMNQFASFEAIKEIMDQSSKQIFLLENTRFHQFEQSTKPAESLELAQKYAELGEYFVDDAFGVSHRREVTNSTLKSILPFSYGISYDNELKNLTKLKEMMYKNHNISKDPQSKTVSEQPQTIVIMGGAKLETKLELVQKILPNVDALLIGGMLSFTFLEAQNLLNLKPKVEIHNSKVETEFLDIAKSLLLKFHQKIILPTDYNFGLDSAGQKLGYDIGENTIAQFQGIIDGAKVIFWNGPLGLCEKKEYAMGTIAIAKSISQNQNAYKVVGGGDTLAFLPNNLESKFNFVSMGGGATLDFLSR